MGKPTSTQIDTEAAPNAIVADGSPASEAQTADEVAQAVAAGLALREGGATKADCAWAIYESLAHLPRDVVVQAFIDGAALTEKGAMTYWYNCRRKANRAKFHPRPERPTP